MYNWGKKEIQKIWIYNLSENIDGLLEPVVNFARVSFESFFRGYFSVFRRRIASYLTRENGKTDRKKIQR